MSVIMRSGGRGKEGSRGEDREGATLRWAWGMEDGQKDDVVDVREPNDGLTLEAGG